MKVLPLYLPHQGCAHTCIYCNQPLVTGTIDERNEWIARLRTLENVQKDIEWEIAFYGGAFSALSQKEMDECFQTIAPFVQLPHVSGVRISTRPDRVSSDVLQYLKKNNVRTIELGAESFDDNVLRKSARGHTAQDTQRACDRIQETGFQLGLHLMCGLPGQDADSWKETIQETVQIRPDFIRIAPTLVLKGTPLERLYISGAYHPLSLEDAIEQCGLALSEFHRNKIPIARVGLALSDQHGEGTDKIIAGPWHPALRHEVESTLACQTIKSVLKKNESTIIQIHPKDISIVQGPQKRNLKAWDTETKAYVTIKIASNQPRYTFTINQGGMQALFIQ